MPSLWLIGLVAVGVVVVGIPVLTSVFAFFGGLFEKCPSPMLRPERTDDPLLESPYLDTMCAQVAGEGYSTEGFFRLNKSSPLKVRVALFVAPDRTSFVMVARIRLGPIRQRKTEIISLTDDGRYLNTTDEPGSADISTVVEHVALMNADFSELAEFHAQRIPAPGIEIVHFAPKPAVDLVDAMETAKLSALVSRGLARAHDGYWRLTIWGAMRSAITVARQTFSAGKYRDRHKLKRPGDPGYTERGVIEDVELDMPEHADIPIARPASPPIDRR